MSNQNAKNELIRLYGAECFIDKLHLRFGPKRTYSSEKQMDKMKKLTYHHIVEKAKGGETSIENGALLSQENHNWFNKQTPAVQRYLNKKFQEYKECKVVLVDDLPTPIKVRPYDIRLKEPYSRSKTKQETKRQLDEFNER